jgi:hypothetical protein
MGIDIASSLLTTLFGLIGVLVGSLIGPLINHRVAKQYDKKEMMFKKKLEYFEKILITVEENKRMYNLAIKKIESSSESKKVAGIVNELKKERKNFFIMSSPLYFDTRSMSDKIVRFVRVEKSIFERISGLEKINKKDMPVFIEQLKQNFNLLNKRGEEILSEMKLELKR